MAARGASARQTSSTNSSVPNSARLPPIPVNARPATAEAWADAPGVRQVLTELTGMLPKGKTVVPAGQNVRMDVIFLERAFRSCEMPYPFDYHVIDLASLFYAWSLVKGEPVAALSLRQAALTAGLIDGPVPHRAMADTELTLDAFRHYIGRLAPRDPSEAPQGAPAGSKSG